MSEEQPADYLLRTCDVCAQAERLCSPQGDAYVCWDCERFHARALNAAAGEVIRQYALFRDPRYGTELTVDEVREVVAIAVKAYCEFTDEPAVRNERSGE